MVKYNIYSFNSISGKKFNDNLQSKINNALSRIYFHYPEKIIYCLCANFVKFYERLRSLRNEAGYSDYKSFFEDFGFIYCANYDEVPEDVLFRIVDSDGNSTEYRKMASKNRFVPLYGDDLDTNFDFKDRYKVLDNKIINNNDSSISIEDRSISVLYLDDDLKNRLLGTNALTTISSLVLSDENLLYYYNFTRKDILNIAAALNHFLSCPDDLKDNDLKDEFTHDKYLVDRVENDVIYYKNCDLATKDSKLQLYLFETRLMHCLLRLQIYNFSELLIQVNRGFEALPGLGRKTIEILKVYMQDYINKNSSKIDNNVYQIDIINRIINEVKKSNFNGLFKVQIVNNLKSEFQVNDIDKCINTLLDNKQIHLDDDKKLYFNFPNLTQYISTLHESKTNGVFMDYLNMNSMQEVSEKVGLTRARVQQIIQNFMKENDLYSAECKVYEDIFVGLFTKYSFDKETFFEIFPNDTIAYKYMKLKIKVRENKSICDAVTDLSLPKYISESIKNYFEKGKEKPTNTEGLLKLYCKEFIRKSMPLENEYPKIISYAKKNYPYLDDVSIETMKNVIMLSKYFLLSFRTNFRYYQIDNYDMNAFIKDLHLERYHNILISTKVLFDENLELMERYDISDFYELHNLLRKNISNEQIKEYDIKFSKMPNIEFGTFSREDFIREILEQYGDMSLTRLCDKISEITGMPKKLINANWTESIKEFKNGLLYSVKKKEIKKLSEEQAIFLKEFLKNDFYDMNEVKEAFSSKFPDDLDALDYDNFMTLGYKQYASYLLINTTTSLEYFNNLLNTKIIDLSTVNLYKKYYCFKNLWSNKLNSLSFVKISKDEYLNMDFLYKSGVEPSNIQQFLNKVNQFAEKYEYFTYKKMINDGFENNILDLGFEDTFYSNLICYGLKMSHTFSNGTYIFSKSHKLINLTDFFAYLIGTFERIAVDDLIDVLEKEYGVYITRDNLRRSLSGSDVYYDSILEIYYKNYELFYKEV